MKRLLACLVVLISLAGCAAGPDLSRQRLEAFPQHYRQFDLVLGWQFHEDGNSTIVDGIVQNVRYAYVDDVEVWVALLDARGKVVTRSVSYVIPIQIPLDDRAPFTVRLPVRVAPGSTVRFTYRYRADEGGDRGGGLTWSQTFDTVVPVY